MSGCWGKTEYSPVLKSRNLVCPCKRRRGHQNSTEVGDNVVRVTKNLSAGIVQETVRFVKSRLELRVKKGAGLIERALKNAMREKQGRQQRGLVSDFRYCGCGKKQLLAFCLIFGCGWVGVWTVNKRVLQY